MYSLKEKFHWNISALEESFDRFKIDLKIDESQENFVEYKDKKIYKNISEVLHWVVYTDTFLFANSKYNKKINLYANMKYRAKLAAELHGIRHLYNYLKHDTTSFKVTIIGEKTIFDTPLFPSERDVPLKERNTINGIERNNNLKTFEKYKKYVQNKSISIFIERVISFFKEINIDDLL